MHESALARQILNAVLERARATAGVQRVRSVHGWVAESERLVTPEVATATFAYYRFRRPSYPADAPRALATRLQAQLDAGRTVYAFFKHEESAAGALVAEAVAQELAAG